MSARRVALCCSGNRVVQRWSRGRSGPITVQRDCLNRQRIEPQYVDRRCFRPIGHRIGKAQLQNSLMALRGPGINQAQVATCHNELARGLMVAACDSTPMPLAVCHGFFPGHGLGKNEYHLGNVLVHGYGQSFPSVRLHIPMSSLRVITAFLPAAAGVILFLALIHDRSQL